MNLNEMKEQLIHWMEEMKHGYRASNMYMVVEEKEQRIRILMYTLTNSYRISAHYDKKNDRTYLGAQAGSRTPRTGEDWCRGNDLADGKFSKETWIKILGDIVGYELVKIHRPIRNLFPKKEEKTLVGTLSKEAKAGNDACQEEHERICQEVEDR